MPPLLWVVDTLAAFRKPTASCFLQRALSSEIDNRHTRNRPIMARHFVTGCVVGSVFQSIPPKWNGPAGSRCTLPGNQNTGPLPDHRRARLNGAGSAPETGAATAFPAILS